MSGKKRGNSNASKGSGGGGAARKNSPRKGGASKKKNPEGTSGGNPCDPFTAQFSEGTLGHNCLILEISSVFTIISGIASLGAGFLGLILGLAEIARGVFGIRAPWPTIRSAKTLWWYMFLTVLIILYQIYLISVGIATSVDFQPVWVFFLLVNMFQWWIARAIRRELQGQPVTMPWASLCGGSDSKA